MLRRCLLVMTALTLFGCAAPREFYRAKSIAISKPTIGEETIARPGDALLEQGTQREYDAIELTEPFGVGVTFGSFTLPAGRYLKSSESYALSNIDYFVWDEVSSPTQGGVVSGGETLKEVALSKKEGSKLVIVKTVNNKLYASDNHPFERVKAIVLDRDSFQQTLIYSGKVGNKINISYREFAGGMARAAFANSAEYDLSESKTIGYQGAQIEVIEATNQFIRYRVISNFSKAKQ